MRLVKLEISIQKYVEPTYEINRKTRGMVNYTQTDDQIVYTVDKI